MREEMTNCPFCDSEDLQIVYGKKIENYYARCNECGAESSNFDTPHEAALAWNRRVEKCGNGKKMGFGV